MRRSVLVASSALVLLALLVSAAFVGARMLRASGEQESEPEFRGRVMEMVSDNGSGPVSQRITVLPAPELPARPSETSGMFVRRQDNSLFVGTGGTTVDVEVDGNTGERVVNLGHTGPEIEVVVNHDTVIYRDETDLSAGDSGERKSGEREVQQVLEPVDSLDEINKQTEFEIWGEQRGDRVVAQILVYRIIDDF